MIILRNHDVRELLDVEGTVDVMRAAYREYREGWAAQIPRIDLYAPAADPGLHRFGTMAGVCHATRTAVVRIKSDVVTWTGGRERKQAAAPGWFSGVAIVYDTDDGRPLAVLQDGFLQHVRVGASAAIGTDLLAPPGSTDVAVIGSGGMAVAMLSCLAHVRKVETVRVWSPTPANREGFAGAIGERLGVEVRAVDDPQTAVRDSGITITATDATEPPLRTEWLEPTSHVTFVSRREVPADLPGRAALLACLGPSSLPGDVDIPGAVLTRGGYVAFTALGEDARRRLPEVRPTDRGDEVPLMLVGPPAHRPAGLTALVAVGTQGIQFAATAGLVTRRALERGVGTPFPDDVFLQDIRT